MRTTVQKSTAAGAVGFLVVMELGSGILQGWLSPLFSSIGEHHGVSAASLNWISAAYLLATVLVVPLLSKLGDIHGHKRILMIATAIVAAASVLVAFAPNFELFLLGRAIQAPLAVFLPLEFAIVHQRDSERSGRSIGRLVAALTLGATIGGLLSGIVLDTVGSLPLTLLLPAIFMALCIPGIAVFVKESPIRSKGKVDYLGAVLLGGGLVAVLGGASNLATWPPLAVGASMLVGGVLLVAWVISARRVEHPLVDLNMLLRGGIGLPILVAFLFGAQLFGAQAPISVYLRSDPATLGFGFGAAASAAGILLSIMALSAFLGATFADRVSRSLGGPRTVAFGGFLGAVAYVLMILAPGTLVTFTVWLVVAGLGTGVVSGTLPTLVVQRAASDSVGIASGLYNTARTAAGGVAGALFALLMSALATPAASGTRVSTQVSFHAVWWICAGLSVLFAVAVLFIRQAKAVPETPTQDRGDPVAAAELEPAQ
ncbi:MFS transporter [Paenarthrobacter histidinolovorans]|uniref:MFS family permease n=1 Tax=Paenarthrobacter histidinolovorans TaxID=43664 RepID=A0ABW8NC42_9MICC